MSFTHVVRQALKRLRYPTVDSNGNLLTNGIVPRNGTLAELLAEVGVGQNEFALTTDVDAIVLYTGTSAGPKVFQALREISVMAQFTGGIFSTSGAQMGLSDTNALDPLGAVDGATGTLIMPDVGDGLASVLFGEVEGFFESLAGLTDPNTTITVRLMRYDTGSSGYVAVREGASSSSPAVEWEIVTDGSGGFLGVLDKKMIRLSNTEYSNTRDFAFLMDFDTTQVAHQNSYFKFSLVTG